jgi:hypothetical protein
VKAVVRGEEGRNDGLQIGGRGGAGNKKIETAKMTEYCVMVNNE